MFMTPPAAPSASPSAPIPRAAYLLGNGVATNGADRGRRRPGSSSTALGQDGRRMLVSSAAQVQSVRARSDARPLRSASPRRNSQMGGRSVQRAGCAARHLLFPLAACARAALPLRPPPRKSLCCRRRRRKGQLGVPSLRRLPAPLPPDLLASQGKLIITRNSSATTRPTTSSPSRGGQLKKLAVADNESGKSTLSEVRTSSGTFIGKGKMGISVVDSSLSGLGGCPYAKGATGNVTTEDVVYTLRGLEIVTNIDLAKLMDAGDYICKHLDQPSVSKTASALSKLTA